MASQKVHGITIDLDVNTSAVNEAFKDINKSLISTQKELTQVDKLLKVDPKNTTLLAQKQYLLSDAIEDTKSKLIQLAKAKEKADKDDGVDKTSKQYRDLERDIIRTKDSLVKLTQQADDNEQALKGISDNARDLGKNLDTASNNASNFGDMLKAKVIGEAIIGGVKALANAFVDLGKGVYDAIRDSGKLADDINTLASQYNLSTKEIQLYIRASDLVDVEINTIAKSMSKLTKNMYNPSTSVAEAFKKLGIATKDSKGQLRDSNQVFNETIEALSKIKNETEQDALALEIFGKSSAELGTLINGGAEELKKFNEYLEKNNLLLSQEELDNLNEMNDSFDILSATIESVKTKVASQLAPVITPLIEQLTQFIVDHKDSIEELVTNFIDYITGDKGREAFDKIKELVEKVGKLIDDLPQIEEDLHLLAKPLEVIADIIGGIVSSIKWIKENLSYVNEARQYNIENYGTGFNLSGGMMHSKGFGNSGGFASGGITLNATFNNNGSLDEASAIKYANIMTQIINDNLGGMI